MKVIVCAMALSMIIFFILAVTGCASQSTRTASMRDGATNRYQQYCLNCQPYVVTHVYPSYAIVGCSNRTAGGATCASCK